MATAHTDNGTACCPDSVYNNPLCPPDAAGFDACECACNDSTTWNAAKAYFTALFGGMGWSVVGPGWGGYSNTTLAHLYRVDVAFISNAPMPGANGSCNDPNRMSVKGGLYEYCCTSFPSYCYYHLVPVNGPPGTCYCQCYGFDPGYGQPCDAYVGPPYYCSNGFYYYTSYECSYTYSAADLLAGCREGCDHTGTAFPYDYTSFYVGSAYLGYYYSCGGPGCYGSYSCPDGNVHLYPPDFGPGDGADWLVAYYIVGL